MVKKVKFKHPRLLPSDRTVSPVFPDLGDEIFQNGVFFFNVSAILKWLEQNPQPIGCVPADIWGSFPHKEDCHVEAADLNRPIVIAEIAQDFCDFVPDFPEHHWPVRGYSCINGQHRLEKARHLGLKTLPAVILRMEQHIPFLYEGYDRYVSYWNGKLIERTEDAHHKQTTAGK